MTAKKQNFSISKEAIKKIFDGYYFLYYALRALPKLLEKLVQPYGGKRVILYVYWGIGVPKK